MSKNRHNTAQKSENEIKNEIDHTDPSMPMGENGNELVDPIEQEAEVPAPKDAFDSEAFIKQHGTKSAAIRALRAEGKEVAEISKLLDIRYQHVRNVLLQPLGAKIPAVTAVSEVNETAESAETE